MSDDLDEDGETERDLDEVIRSVIGRMDAFVADLPLEAVLRPFRNYYAPDIPQPAVVLTDLFAEKPGGGHGSAYIAKLFEVCDEEGLAVYTDADGPRSRDFYLARGFEVTTGARHHQLVRWAPLPPELADEMGISP